MTLQGPTIADNGSISASTRTYVQGGITHMDTDFMIINGLLTGTGAINFNGGGLGGTFTQDVGHTIEGGAGIFGTITNNGTIVATVPDVGITLDGPAATNNGVIKANFQSFIYIDGTTVTQSSAGRIIADAGVVDFNLGATVNGGTFTSLHGGLVTAEGSDTFSGVINTGAFEALSSSTVNIGGNSSNSGSLTVDSAATLNIVAQATLSTTGAFANNGRIVVNSTNDGVHGATLTSTTPIIGTGTLSLLPLGSIVFTKNAGGSIQDGVTITGSGRIDLSNNHLLINYAPNPDPAAMIRSYLAEGYNGGAWNGPGINSSAAAANSAYALGYADGKDGKVFGLSSGQIEVKYTLLGDANLDGLVNAADFTILAANFNQPVTGWDQGDFNYDGLVNAADFT
ncbi:MAG: dockerin type I domain-containing protein, partial [Tepidisphaeraceae bacterium]